MPTVAFASLGRLVGLIRMLACSVLAWMTLLTPASGTGCYCMLFDRGSAELNAASRAVVAEVVGIVVSLDGTDYGLYVEGNTDSVGSRAANQALSCRRAEAVRDALIAAGVAPDRIFIDGYGETRPAVETGDGVYNQANRRVKVTIFRGPTRWHTSC